MNGSARKLPSGRWQLRVYVGRDPITGKDQYATRTVDATTKKNAEKQLPRFIVDLEDEATPTAGTVGFLLDETIRHLRNRNREPTTLRGYEGCARAIKEEFGNVTVTALTVQHVNRYYDKMSARGVKPGTVANHHRFLRRAFNLAVRWGWVTTNVITLADPPAMHRGEVAPPSSDIVQKIIEAARAGVGLKDPSQHVDMSADLAFALTIAAALGCRRGDLCGLRWSDIDLETGAVKIERAVKQLTKKLVEDPSFKMPPGYEVCGPALVVGDVKSHASRRLTIGAGVLVMLNGQHVRATERARWAGTILHADAYVLSDDADGAHPWRPDRLTKGVERLRDSVGWSAGRFHDLRHWNVSELLDRGEDVTVAASRAGHRDKSVTHNIYAHMKPAADQRAADIIDDALFGADELRAKRKRRRGA